MGWRLRSLCEIILFLFITPAWPAMWGSLCSLKTHPVESSAGGWLEALRILSLPFAMVAPHIVSIRYCLKYKSLRAAHDDFLLPASHRQEKRSFLSASSAVNPVFSLRELREGFERSFLPTKCQLFRHRGIGVREDARLFLAGDPLEIIVDGRPNDFGYFIRQMPYPLRR